MEHTSEKIKVGILGCGAIGSGIAKSIFSELKDFCQLTAVYDVDQKKCLALQDLLPASKIAQSSYGDLLKECDLVVEAVNAKNIHDLIKQALEAKKNILVMSTGQLLEAQDLFDLAAENNCNIILPSGAIAGIDAIKSASLVEISSITLTTRKPTTGFANVPYLAEVGIDPSKITEETTIFEGGVAEAVKAFPRNINVAATLALASKSKDKLVIRIVTSPDFKTNSHEIEAVGAFGKIVARTENTISPDNPKTSYLAVLSGIQTLKSFCCKVKIGT